MDDGLLFFAVAIIIIIILVAYRDTFLLNDPLKYIYMCKVT